MMKKRLCKAMPHVPLLKLRPEPSVEVIYDQESIDSTENRDVVNGYGEVEVNINHDSAMDWTDKIYLYTVSKNNFLHEEVW